MWPSLSRILHNHKNLVQPQCCPSHTYYVLQETHSSYGLVSERYRQLPELAVPVEVEAESDIDATLPVDKDQPGTPVPGTSPELESEIQPPHSHLDPELYEREVKQLNSEAEEGTLWL